MRRTLPLLLLGVLALPATASAAPPSNDARTAPRELSTPASVTGTTVDSTLETDELGGCQPLKGSVYYELTAAEAKTITVRLAAQGDLDATVEVFRRTRSQLAAVDCESSDDKGRAELSFKAAKDGRYLIRVGQRLNSVAGTFSLDVFVPTPPPTAPGPQLPKAGVSRTLDQVQDQSDAWSASLRQGGRYRINLSPSDTAAGDDGCVELQVFGPGTKDFDEARPVRTLRCGGYAVIAPGAGEGGRYSFLVTARPKTIGPQRYHLQLAASGPDDASPGIRLSNFETVRGSLDATGVDVVDLFRFDVTRRSALNLTLAGGRGFQLRLLTANGGTLDTSQDDGTIERDIKRGRYFLAVSAPAGARGRYRLTRATRTITRTSIAFGGRKRASISPGSTTRVGLRTSPRVSGPVAVTIERFDPLEGWQFDRTVRTRVSNGRGGFGFTPPSTGKWRARAAFKGTRSAAPSTSGLATVTVEGPLRQR
ncbi:pre-peptidase C-terminal domain-containing protein [Patulibacter minatonensis]|uniref:pre-peptidase C-terminal domain-containing protein n=1 Tax=Patulibacter minatonensis TaxID=298163 RepID=UPI0004B072ED|nr:pre-peptidase C-terminal domain-containing protein [Patulibacter minatonensis]